MTDGGLRRELEHNLRRRTEAAVILSEDLAAHPEVSGREYRSSRKIVDVLREGGLEVEHPFREMATAFRAAKEGGAAAKVALLVEYDALPDLGHGSPWPLSWSASTARLSSSARRPRSATGPRCLLPPTGSSTTLTWPS